MEWLKRLAEAINYIESNLNGDISYDEAAKIACCSTHYFQRMFTCVAGITMSEYIRRRRMTQAAFELQSTDIRVIDAALKYGYSSPTSFNRAFQAVHGISPVAARLKGIQLNAYPPIKFSVQITGGLAMSYRVEEKKAMRIVGIRMALTEDMDENHKIIPDFWQSTLKSAIFPEICAMANQSPDGVLGVSYYDGSEGFYYYIGVATDSPVPEGMYECTIPEASWVIFGCDGPFKESIQNIYRRFFTEWLPFSGYSYAELPDMEVYPITKEPSAGGYSEMWITVKKEDDNGRR